MSTTINELRPRWASTRHRAKCLQQLLDDCYLLLTKDSEVIRSVENHEQVIVLHVKTSDGLRADVWTATDPLFRDGEDSPLPFDGMSVYHPAGFAPFTE